jgi:hypothetical protein
LSCQQLLKVRETASWTKHILWQFYCREQTSQSKRNPSLSLQVNACSWASLNKLQK